MNPELELTLDDAVAEVLGTLTGLDLQYAPEEDRYQSITRALNRALRSNALEHEWSYYFTTLDIGTATEGQWEVELPNTVRPRIVGSDSVRLQDDTGHTWRWSYFIPRDAVNQYQHQRGSWVTITRTTLQFSRPFNDTEDGLHILVPVMREPEMYRLPAQPQDPDSDAVVVPDSTRQQLVDFQYPDLITLRAAFYYAQTDPVMQPRVQTLEAQYKDLMYQIIERDDRNTDNTYLTPFEIPVTPELRGDGYQHAGHPWA